MTADAYVDSGHRYVYSYSQEPLLLYQICEQAHTHETLSTLPPCSFYIIEDLQLLLNSKG